MAYSEDKEPDELRRGGHQQRGGKASREAPDAEPDPAGEQPFRKEELHVPGPGRPVGKDGDQVERVAEGGLALSEERRPRGIVPVPERKLGAEEKRAGVD